MSLCNSFTEPLSYRDCHISGSFSDQKKNIFDNCFLSFSNVCTTKIGSFDKVV